MVFPGSFGKILGQEGSLFGDVKTEQKSRFSGEAGTGVCCLLMSFTLVSVAQSSGHAYMTVSWEPLFASPEM